MEKGISYLSRDFNSIKSELITFSKRYYPELATSFEDSSVGSWFIDLVSSVGDDLSYSIDRAYQEGNINSVNQRSSVLNIARMNGVKIPGPKASMCEIEITCTLPTDNSGSAPNYDFAPIVKKDTQVGAGNSIFELEEDVDFSEQFNQKGYSNRKFYPNRDSNGNITSYTVGKTVMALGGQSKVYKRVLNENEIEPFMEVVLPDKDVMNVESIIFKSTTGLSHTPETSQFYMEEEEKQFPNEFVKTYRFFEVVSLSNVYRLGDAMNVDENGKGEIVPMDEKYGIYKCEWKGVKQKFITEYTDNGYLKIIFGASNEVDTDDIYGADSSADYYAKYRMSHLVNNVMLGALPRAGWTMYVLYRVGGGVESNVAIGSVNKFVFKHVDLKKINDNSIASDVLKSLAVTNLTNAIAGKDAPSTEELKNYIKYNIGSQQRCVTVNDYKAKIAEMPPRYGTPFRYNVIEENNKIMISLLHLDFEGKLTSFLPSRLVENLKEYLARYRTVTDYVEMKSGKIYNLGIELDVFIDKNYTTEYVMKVIFETISTYFHVDNHMMGGSIFLGDLEKEINQIDGVISIIDLRVYNIYNGEYGVDGKFPSIGSVDNYDGGSNISQIDLASLDNLLENDYDSMFEIKNLANDVKIKVKLK